MSRVRVPFPAQEDPPLKVDFLLYGGVAKWLRRRSAKPLFIGSNPIAASTKLDLMSGFFCLPTRAVIGEGLQPGLMPGESDRRLN